MPLDITPATSVGRIATALPQLIPELESLGIDYCCGGRYSLEEVARRRGADPHAIASRLNDLAGRSHPPSHARDPAAMSMTELADHIEQTHHVYARSILSRLTELLGKCVAAHANEHPAFIELRATVAALTDDMHDHFVREERVLFPWLRRLERKSEITSGPPWSVRRPIDCMVHDHDDVGEAFARIRNLTDNLTAPPHACPTWRECYSQLAELEHDTHIHIHKENNILFPAGVKAEEQVHRANSSRIPQ